MELEVLDAEVLDDPSSAEGGAEESEPIEGQEEQPEESGSSQAVTLFQPDGKKLSPAVRTILEKLKTETPQVAKSLTRAAFRMAELDREFPGGLSEARELRDKVEELGGLSGIEEKFQSLQELDGLAKAYMDADPAFVEDLIASSRESFASLAPILFAKFAEVSPDGWKAYIGRVVYQDLSNNSIPLLIQRLGDYLPADRPQAAELLQTLSAYLEQFRTLASSQPTPIRRAASKQNDGLSEREEALRSKEWNSERTGIQKAFANVEYSKALAGRKPDATIRAQIAELYTVRSAKLTDIHFPKWKETVQGYIKRNDKNGFVRYVKSIYARVIPEAMASAVQSSIRGKAPIARTGAPAERPKPVSVTPGFVPVAKEPGTFEIDYVRTNKSMIEKNQAVLRDGRKVQWK